MLKQEIIENFERILGTLLRAYKNCIFIDELHKVSNELTLFSDGKSIDLKEKVYYLETSAPYISIFCIPTIKDFWDMMHSFYSKYDRIHNELLSFEYLIYLIDKWQTDCKKWNYDKQKIIDLIEKYRNYVYKFRNNWHHQYNKKFKPKNVEKYIPEGFIYDETEKIFKVLLSYYNKLNNKKILLLEIKQKINFNTRAEIKDIFELFLQKIILKKV